jgi:20S proteasome subunit alpha 3
MEAISHAGTALAILAHDGVILAAEKKLVSKLLEQHHSNEKIYPLVDHVVCAVAGITSDANILINYARSYAQNYYTTYNEPSPVEQLVERLCTLKQGYTQFGGLRPFGVSFLYAGYDKHYGFQLYHSDPSGNYAGWKATCIGANHQAAQSIMKNDYTDEMDVKQASALALKVLSKTMDAAELTSDKLEFATLTLVEGVPTYKIYSPSELTQLLKEHEAVLQQQTPAE